MRRAVLTAWAGVVLAGGVSACSEEAEEGVPNDDDPTEFPAADSKDGETQPAAAESAAAATIGDSASGAARSRESEGKGTDARQPDPKRTKLIKADPN